MGQLTTIRNVLRYDSWTFPGRREATGKSRMDEFLKQKSMKLIWQWGLRQREKRNGCWGQRSPAIFLGLGNSSISIHESRYCSTTLSPVSVVSIHSSHITRDFIDWCSIYDTLLLLQSLSDTICLRSFPSILLSSLIGWTFTFFVVLLIIDVID